MKLNVEQCAVVKERLMSRRVLKAFSDCWEWPKSTLPRGYAVTKVRSVFGVRGVLVHRMAAAAFMQFDIDSELQVCHSCDNPLCFRPRHLFIGTQLDNMQDMWSKNRGAHYARKLTPESIRVIRKLRASGVAQTEVARLAGVSDSTIRAITDKRIWAHI